MASAVGAVVGIVSTVISVANAKKQSDAQKAAQEQEEQARRVERARAQRENQRRRREQLRRQRIERASVVSQGAGSNVLESSGVQGGAGSIVSQAQGNINEIGMQEGFTQARNSFLNNAADERSSANRFATNAGIGIGLLNLGEQGFEAYQSFGGQNDNPGGVSDQFLKDNPSYASVMSNK